MRLRATERLITTMWVCWHVTLRPITPSAVCGRAIGLTNAALLNLLPAWVACDADLQRILVDNPAQLYGFDA